MTSVLYNKELVGEVLDNHSITYEEILEYALKLSSLDNQEELKQLYEDGNSFVFVDDDGMYCLDVNDFEFKEE